MQTLKQRLKKRSSVAVSQESELDQDIDLSSDQDITSSLKNPNQSSYLFKLLKYQPLRNLLANHSIFFVPQEILPLSYLRQYTSVQRLFLRTSSQIYD